MSNRSLRYLCKWQLVVAKAGCISVPFAFPCSREIPRIELCSFWAVCWEAGAGQLLRGPYFPYSVCALSVLQLRLGSAFGDPWPPTALAAAWGWFLPQGPQAAAERSWSSLSECRCYRGREAAPEHLQFPGLAEPFPVAGWSVLYSPRNKWHLNLEEMDEKTEN